MNARFRRFMKDDGRDIAAQLAAFMSIFICIGLFGLFSTEAESLPTGNEFPIAVSSGLAVLALLLALLRPRRWAMITALVFYFLLAFPFTFHVGCFHWGECI